jgi:hypothetical protein
MAMCLTKYVNKYTDLCKGTYITVLMIWFGFLSELTTGERLRRIFLHYILKIVVLIAALYIFICSLNFLGDAFKLLGGKFN